MAKLANSAALKEAIEAAEKRLEELKDDSSRKAEKRIKKINKALEPAYEVFNKNLYDPKIINKRTDEVWLSLMDNSKYLTILILLVGILLSGSLIFAGYEIYAVLDYYVIGDKTGRPLDPQDSDLIKVQYIENKVVSLYDQMSVSDQEGWNNPKQTFIIRNDGSKAGQGMYSVNYKVKIVPLNKNDTKLIDTEYIKYRYRYYDSAKNKYTEYKMGNLKDLIDENGEMILNKAFEEKNAHHDYEVTFWISAHAKDEYMGASYTFAFQVDASITGA